ncbi:MAG: serine/threonine protein kinase [Planctomycetes bacterium]|nr:serine/threonine protein kinase [Planctomycetota bacterium]
MSECPDISAWELLSQGGVEDAAAEHLRMHLETCRECRTAFDNVRRNERLLESMKIAWNDCADAAPLGPAPIGMKIGRYEVTGFLGTGGMAAVYRAVQEQPHRTVALKLMKLGFASRAALRRFEHEAELLGRLHHPGIAHIYEAGVAEVAGQRQPFFAMELIDGQKLTDYANSRNLTMRQRLELIVRIGEAVHYAHQKGVIHRDLKPSNILVAEEADSADRARVGAVGQPKVLDFGVARATDVDIQATTVQTDIGQLVGTIPYMSPEQTVGDPKELDVRSDVYALGVVCYELLAGLLPYSVKGRSVPDAVRVIQHDDPTPLSSINRVFRGDIETIVAKALEKDKERRYVAVSALVADIRRYLNDEPIAARPPSATYQLAKFARRIHCAAVGIGRHWIWNAQGYGFTKRSDRFTAHRPGSAGRGRGRR